MLDLVRTKTPQPTIVPKWVMMKIYDILDFYGIKHIEVNQNDFEEGWPGWAFFNGKTYSDNVYAIVACVTPESLVKAAEESYQMSPDWIKEYLTLKENGSELPPYLYRLENHITEPFQPVLEAVEEPETMIVPVHFKNDVEYILVKRGIPFTIEPIADSKDLSVTYRGKTYTTKLYAINSRVSVKSLAKALEDIAGLAPDEVE